MNCLIDYQFSKPTYTSSGSSLPAQPADPVQQPLTPGPDPLTLAPSTSTDPTASAPISSTQSTHPTITHTRDNTRKPRAFPDHVGNMATLHPWPLESSPTEPTCFSMANKCSI